MRRSTSQKLEKPSTQNTSTILRITRKRKNVIQRAARPEESRLCFFLSTQSLACYLVLLFLGLTAFNTQDRIAAYESPERTAWQKPDGVIQALKITEGSQVADLGSGSGYFTFRLADATGPSGTVYAVDVNAEMNEYVNGRADKGGYKNVSTILAATDDPKLPEGGIDLVFSCNSYHHLENRTPYFENIKRYLKPGARVAIIDFRKEAFRHHTESHIIKQEMEAAGYKLEEEIDTLPRQHFLIFSVGSGN